MLIAKCFTNSIRASGEVKTECLTLAISLRHIDALDFINEQVGEGIFAFKIKNNTSTISLSSKYSFQELGTY